MKVSLHPLTARFVLFTVVFFLVKESMKEGNLKRSRDFFEWVKNEWDEKGDNIFLWDLYELETEGGVYLKDDYAVKPGNSHPSSAFAKMTAPFFCRRIVNVIDGNGDS